MLLTYILSSNLGGVPAGLASLTWVALAESPVYFGHQARYYSLTLFLSVLVASLLWQTARGGRWRRFDCGDLRFCFMKQAFQKMSACYSVKTTNVPLVIQPLLHDKGREVSETWRATS